MKYGSWYYIEREEPQNQDSIANHLRFVLMHQTKEAYIKLYQNCLWGMHLKEAKIRRDQLTNLILNRSV